MSPSTVQLPAMQFDNEPIVERLSDQLDASLNKLATEGGCDAPHKERPRPATPKPRNEQPRRSGRTPHLLWKLALLKTRRVYVGMNVKDIGDTAGAQIRDRELQSSEKLILDQVHSVI